MYKCHILKLSSANPCAQCEHFRRVKLPGCSKAAGRDIIQSVIVLDLDGLSYKQFSSEVMSILSTIATMDQVRALAGGSGRQAGHSSAASDEQHTTMQLGH